MNIKIISFIVIILTLSSCIPTANKKLADELKNEVRSAESLTIPELEKLLMGRSQLDVSRREDPKFGENNYFGASCEIVEIDLNKSTNVDLKCSYSYKDHSHRSYRRHATKFKKKNTKATLCPTTMEAVKYFGYKFPVVSGVKLKRVGKSRKEALKAFNTLRKLCRN